MRSFGQRSAIIALAIFLSLGLGWIDWTIRKAITYRMWFHAVPTVTNCVGIGLLPKKLESPLVPSWHFEYLGTMQVTAYRSTPEQCKPKGYFWTSIGEHVNSSVVAVSQDLLKQGIVKYHDTICIEDIGCKQVLDCMNARWTRRLDCWVPTYDDEKAFDKKFRGRKLRIWKINGGINETYRRLHYHSK